MYQSIKYIGSESYNPLTNFSRDNSKSTTSATQYKRKFTDLRESNTHHECRPTKEFGEEPNGQERQNKLQRQK